MRGQVLQPKVVKPTVRAKGAIVNVLRPVGPFSIVPDSILKCLELDSDSRLVLAYLAGRPAGWKPLVAEICGSLGLTDWAWRRVRNALTRRGVMTQRLVSGGRAQLMWELNIDLSEFYKT